MLARQPRNADAHNFLALVELRAGAPDKALGAIDEALRLRPEHPPAHTNRAMILRHLGRDDEAISSLREALRLRPDFPQALLPLAQLVARDDLGEAAALCRRALELQPQWETALLLLARILISDDRPREALSLLEESQAFKQGSPEFLALAAGHSGEPGRRRVRGSRAFARPWPRTPNLHRGYGDLGSLLMTLGRLDEAEEALRHALDMDPQDAGAANDLGLLLRRLERPEGGLGLAPARCANERRTLPLDRFDRGIGRMGGSLPRVG